MVISLRLNKIDFPYYGRSHFDKTVLYEHFKQYLKKVFDKWRLRTNTLN